MCVYVCGVFRKLLAVTVSSNLTFSWILTTSLRQVLPGVQSPLWSRLVAQGRVHQLRVHLAPGNRKPDYRGTSKEGFTYSAQEKPVGRSSEPGVGAQRYL